MHLGTVEENVPATVVVFISYKDLKFSWVQPKL